MAAQYPVSPGVAESVELSGRVRWRWGSRQEGGLCADEVGQADREQTVANLVVALGMAVPATMS